MTYQECTRFIEKYKRFTAENARASPRAHLLEILRVDKPRHLMRLDGISFVKLGPV